jgi:hypothetical protein
MFRPAHCAGTRDQSGRDAAGRLQLLRAGTGGAACGSPRDLPGRRDALAADAAEALTEAFSEFLFPNAADGDEPQA